MFDYNFQLYNLWCNMRSKLTEKMSDSRRFMSEELKQIQGRHRKFYKVQLSKHQLDKFEPADMLKKEIKYLRAIHDQQKGRNRDGKKQELVHFPMLNFQMTLLMYEDVFLDNKNMME